MSSSSSSRSRARSAPGIGLDERAHRIVHRCDLKLTRPRRSTSRDRGDRHPLGRRRPEERAVASDDNEIRITHTIGPCQMNAVVPAKAMGFGKVSGASSQLVVDLDDIELLESCVQLMHRFSKLASGEPSETVCLSEGCAALGVDKPDAHNPVSSIPQQCSTSGAGLDDEQRNDG